VVGDFNEWTRGLASRLMGDAFEVVEPRAFLPHARSIPEFFRCFISTISTMTRSFR